MPVDCLLIYPFLEEANWKNELRSKDNLALGYLTSCARAAGFSVSMMHAEHLKYTVDDVKNVVSKLEPKVIGISCTAQRAYTVVREYARAIREISSAHIFLGGIFPTIAYKAILNDCNRINAICLGEGERFIVDYLNCVINNQQIERIAGIAYYDSAGELIVNPQSADLIDLDSLPFPAKDYFDDMKAELENGFYYINISAGRGCYGNCSFCSLKKLTYSVERRTRSPSNVVDEIEFFQKKYGVSYFKFVDEQFIDKHHPEWIADFCDELAKRKIKIKFHIEARVDSIQETVIKLLKEAGLDEVFVGLESGDIGLLKKYRKGHSPHQAEAAIALLRKYEINVQYGYIMIDSCMTFEQLKNNIFWILKLGGYSKHNLYNKLNMYYGTDIYLESKKQSTFQLPFYERETTIFKDKRVKMFSELVDIAKMKVSKYNATVNSYLLTIIKDKATASGWKAKASVINSYEVIIWERIILEALSYATRLDETEKNKWGLFIDGQVNLMFSYFQQTQE